MGFTGFPVGAVGSTPQLGGPGLALITTFTFSATSAVAIDGCFTSNFQNYLIVCAGSSSAGAFVAYNMRLAGSNNTSANYHQQILAANATTVSGSRDAAQTFGKLGYFPTTNGAFTAQVFRPAEAVPTQVTSIPVHTPATPEMYDIRGGHNVATAYDGISLSPSAGTMSGTVTVYGYRKA